MGHVKMTALQISKAIQWIQDNKSQIEGERRTKTLLELCQEMRRAVGIEDPPNTGNVGTFIKWIVQCGIDYQTIPQNPKTTSVFTNKIKGLEDKILSLETAVAELNESVSILKRVLRENDTDLDKLCERLGIKRSCGE